MTKRTVIEFKLSRLIAEDLFKLGNNPNSPCTRIAFMAESIEEDIYKQETQQGGLCEEALVDFLEACIETHLAIIKIT
jgi:hypothetical protein